MRVEVSSVGLGSLQLSSQTFVVEIYLTQRFPTKNVVIFFYLIGIFQKSFWLIDPYWSIIPPVFAVMWRAHPLAIQSTRGDVAMVLTFIWGIRLTYSYFRREEWKFGTREDWRYTKMAIDFGRPLWYFMSFLAVGLA